MQRITRVDLTRIDGSDVMVAQTILEYGDNPERSLMQPPTRPAGSV